MLKKCFLLVLLLLGLLVFGGCSVSPTQTQTVQATLPPIELSYVAPIGDAALEYELLSTLYLPDYSHTYLTAVNTMVTYSVSRPPAESLIRALLNFAGDPTASSIGGDVQLSLYGANPVEISLDTATVNLGASALQLDRESFYVACQAITNTLTASQEIQYVNILVVDKPVGLDIANQLPMGTLRQVTGEDLSATYNQLLAYRTQAAQDPDNASSATVTIYHPLSNSDGIVAHVHSCSFEDQSFTTIATTLLRQISLGLSGDIVTPSLPLLTEMLEAEPELIYSSTAGGQVITFAFSHQLDDMLSTYDITRTQAVACLTYTFCTYFPNILGIEVTIGSQAVETLMLTDSFTSSITFEEGLLERADFASLLYDTATLYFANENQTALIETLRPLPFYQKNNPRALLVELVKGPLNGDSVTDLLPVMAVDALTDADLLGFSLTDTELVVNLAATFLTQGDNLDENKERLLTYAIVNTLCLHPQVESICFYIAGEQIDSLGGTLDWQGRFYPMPI